MAQELKFYNPDFEREVRNELLITDAPITVENALNLYDLDCSDFRFDSRDFEALTAFKNLDWLQICVSANDLRFLQELPLLETLRIETWSSNNVVDFNQFSSLTNLKSLMVSGGDISSIDYKNLEGLHPLTKLENLTLHEFGTVDLSPLRGMIGLTGFYCGYANKVYNIDAIASLTNLEGLTLIDIDMDNLDFLDAFPDSLIVDLCGLRVKQGVDYGKFSRFVDIELDDIESTH